MDSIKVAIKVRPLIKREREDNLPIQWIVQDNSIAPLDPELKKRGEPLYFDHVFDSCKTNYDVFDVIAKPIVNAAINGINGTIFAYGQTSSGKTYTMMGEKDCPGVIPLAVQYIFDQIKNTYDREFLLRVSYIEIYNEKIHDLLDKEGIDLKIKEDKGGQANVLCKEEVVNCPETVLGIMRKGLKNRKIGETNMNDKSSRSHTIFRVIIESREPNTDGVVHVSQLNLVDLAGSERPKQTGATGDRFNEGKHINLSLSSLALVIMQLSEHQENPLRYINFRDSKLTRILRSSLGGNAMTTIICAVTPAAVEETQNTLAFASRAKRIHNKPQVNECISEAALLKRYAKQLAKLESQLAKAQGANLEEMESKLMEKESKLMEKDRAYQLLEERIELLKTRIVSGNSSPEDEPYKRRSNRRRTWGGPGTCQTKLSSFQTLGLPTIKETEKSPEKDKKKEQRKKRQSIIQSMEIPNQTWETDFTDFELELIESERARMRLSDGSGGGDDDFAVTKRPYQRHVQFREDVAILEEERTTPEVTPEKKKSEVPSPGTPKSVLRSRLDFLREQFVSLKDDHSSIVEYTTLERQMFVDEAVEAAMVEQNKIVESLKEELAQSEKSKRELLEKYEKLESHSAESDKRLGNLQKELATSTSSLRALKMEKETLIQELKKLKSPETTKPINQPSENTANDEETSSIFANCSYFDEMEVSDLHSDSQLTNDTTNMESVLTTDTSLANNASTNRMDVSKECKDDTNATFSEFMKDIAERSNEELVRVTQDLFNAKLSLQEENSRLEATLRQKIREADDVGNDIRELNLDIEKLQETIKILMTENTDLSSKLSNEKEFAEKAEKSFQSTIAELNSTIEKMNGDKILVEKSMEELHKKSDSSSTIDEERSNAIERYKQQIKSLIMENNELSSNVMSLTEDLELLRAGKEIPGEHECDYRRSMLSLLERNKSLVSENAEMSSSLMDKIEEYDILKKDYERLSSKFSSLSQQEISQNLLNLSINCSNLLSNEVATDAERSTLRINGESVPKLDNCKFGEAQFAEPTIDDLLRLSLPPSHSDQILKTNGQTIEDSSQASVVPVDAPNLPDTSKEESIEEYKLKAQMLEEQVEKLTLLNDKLRQLKISSCKQCAHLVELRQNRKMLEKEVKTLSRTLEDLQTKFDCEFADTKILRTKASEDINLSICDASFNASFNLEGGTNVSILEERVQSMRNEIESLKTERGALSNLCKEKCEEIEKLQDHSTRESSPASLDSPRLRRDDVRLDRIQKDTETLQKDLRVLRKSIESINAALHKSDNVKRMQNEIETLKSEKIELEKKLMETKSFSLASEKCESLENKIASLNSEISKIASVKEELERQTSQQSNEIESLKLEKEKLNEKLTQESKSLEIAHEKFQAMTKEVDRLNSLISNYEADTEKLKSTKSSLEMEMQVLAAEKQILQEKLVEIESSFVPQEKVDSLVKEIARMSAEINNYETTKEQLEETKLSLEAEIRVLKAEKDEGKLTVDENIVQKDETIKLLNNKVSQLLSDLEDSAVVKNQLENAKLRLEADQEKEKLSISELIAEKDCTIEELKTEVARLASEIDDLNVAKNQLENAKSALEADQEKENLSISELIAEKDCTIEELKTEVARLASEIDNLNVAKNQLENAKSALEADQEKEKLSISELIAEKDCTIEELKTEVARLASEIDDLNVAKNQLENAKSALEADQEKEKLSISELIAEKDCTIEELKTEVARLASEIDDLNVAKNQLENAKSALEADQEKENLSISELIAEKDCTIEELKTEVARLASEIDNLNVAKNQLENAKSALEADQEKEKLSISELIAEKDCTIEELKTEVARLASEIDDLNVAKNQLENAKSALEADQEKEKRSISELIAEKDCTIEELKTEVARLASEIDNLNVVKNQLESAKSALEADQENEKLSINELIAEKDCTIEELKTEVARLASEIDDLNVAKNQLENAKSALEADQEKENLSISKLIAEKDCTIEELKTEVARLASEIDDLNVVKNQLVSAKSGLETEIGTLKAVQEKERHSTSELIAAKDCTIEELKTEVARLACEIENSNAVRMQIEEAKSSLEAELNVLKIEKESFEEILSKKEDVSLAEGKVKSLENELSRLIVEVEASQVAKKELEEVKSRLENKVVSLKEENEAVKQKLLDVEMVARSQEKIALEEKVESLLMEKTEIEESQMNLRETLSKLNEKNASLSEELRSMKSKEVGSGETMDSGRSNGLEHTDSSISTKEEKSPLICSYEKILEELETAKKSMTKEIMALKPSTDDMNFEEKSTSELFGFFVTTIMAREQEVIKTLIDDFEREKRKLVENKRQSIDAEKRATDWAKELEAEIERNEQDLTLEKSKNTALSEKISSLENLLLETKYENQMLKEKMDVLVADFDTMEIKLERPSESRQNSMANSSQNKECFMPENVDTREMELSSKLRQAEKQYKEKLNELTSSLEHLKTRNIELSNNLEGLEANEKQLQKIIDMKTTELAKCNLTIERLQSELDVMTESFSQSSRENMKKDEKISEITTLLKTKCDILSEYKTKLETITPEYEKLKEQAIERQLKLEKYKSEIQCLTAENEKTISSLKDRLDSEEMKCVGYRKQLAELTNRNTTLQMELVELKAKCEELEISNAKMVHSMRNSTSKIRAEEEMEDLRDQNRTLERNLDGAGNRIAELQDAKTRLTQELVDLRVQYETTFAQNEELKSVLSSHRSSVADTIEWREKYEAALQEKSRLEMELMAKRPRFEQTEKKMELLERENEELKAKNVELDAEMDDIACKINEMRTENANLDEQLYNAQNTIESLKTKITQLTTTNFDLERKVKDCVDEIESLKTQRRKLRSESGASLKTLNNENSELRMRLSQLDRGDALSCGDSDRSSSPALEAARVDNRRRRSRNELFNVNRPLETCDTEKDDNCQCDIYKQQCKKLEQELVLKKARITTLELKIQSEIFPHMRKCKDLEEIVGSLRKKNNTLRAEVRDLQEIRAREISSECARCKNWKENKRDQASQCIPPIMMSGMSSGIIDALAKNAKLEKERNAMKNLCRSRAQKNIELEKSIEELKQRIIELERGTKVSNITDKTITSDSSTFNTILIPDSSNPRREAMKENVPAIWENPKQSLTTRRNWFN